MASMALATVSSSHRWIENRKEPHVVLYDHNADIDQLRTVYNTLKFSITYVQDPPGIGKIQTILTIVVNCMTNAKTLLISWISLSWAIWDTKKTEIVLSPANSARDDTLHGRSKGALIPSRCLTPPTDDHSLHHETSLQVARTNLPLPWETLQKPCVASKAVRGEGVDFERPTA
ncbi:MAG: hypothetical protein ACKODM_04955 [Cytophagales bacterium]